MYRTAPGTVSTLQGLLGASLEVKRVSPQGQPLLHLPEKTCVELVQRLEGGEDGVLQRVRGRLVLSYGVLERLRTQKHTGLKQQGKFFLI